MSRKSYPTDISDAEWDLIKSHSAEQKRKRGKKREVDMREVVNAIFYILRAGVSLGEWCHMIKVHGKLYTRIFNVGNVKVCGKKFTLIVRSQLREISGPDIEPFTPEL